jgi:hypothetical protein
LKANTPIETEVLTEQPAILINFYHGLLLRIPGIIKLLLAKTLCGGGRFHPWIAVITKYPEVAYSEVLIFKDIRNMHQLVFP